MALDITDGLTGLIHELANWGGPALTSRAHAETVRFAPTLEQAMADATPKGKTGETAKAWKAVVDSNGQEINLRVENPGTHSAERGKGAEFIQIVTWLEEGRGEVVPTQKQALFWAGLPHPVMKAKATSGKPFADAAYDAGMQGFEAAIERAVEKDAPA